MAGRMARNIGGEFNFVVRRMGSWSAKFIYFTNVVTVYIAVH